MDNAFRDNREEEEVDPLADPITSGGLEADDDELEDEDDEEVEAEEFF